MSGDRGTRPGRRVIVYVDGFNLYYGALRYTAYKWLDLGKLCQKYLPNDEIVGIKYFTALVKPRPGHPRTAQSQQVYLRALQTIPNLSIHLGHFLTKRVSRALVKPPKHGSPFRTVWNTEEKGSDVNLASYLLIDGFRARYDMAVVISNDSDLSEPIRFVRYDLDAPVGVLNPHPKRSYQLSPSKLPRGSFYKPIRNGALASSQFPTRMTDAQGAFRKPADW